MPRSTKKRTKRKRAAAKSKRPPRVGKTGVPSLAKMGRPTLITPELTQAIVVEIEHGAYAETAAALQGLSKTTLYDWLKTGARLLREKRPLTEAEQLYADFSNAISQALARFEGRCVRGLLKAGAIPKHWQALAWILERKHPDRYGRKMTLKVPPPSERDEGLNFDPGKLATGELEQLAVLLERAMVDEQPVSVDEPASEGEPEPDA